MPRARPTRPEDTQPLAPCDPDPDPLACVVDGLLYRLDALPLRHGKRSVLSVRLADGDGGPALVDRADLYSFRSRRACAQLEGDAFACEVSQVLGHLALLLDQTERAQASEPRAAPERLSPERQAAAEALLVQPRLLDRAAAVMDQLGYVGEEVPKRLAYLVATSRLLARPLSAIVFAPSGSGKSELLETVARLVPEEAVEFLSRLTPQALFYAGPEHLRHKLVLVDEHVGAAEADASIRTL